MCNYTGVISLIGALAEIRLCKFTEVDGLFSRGRAKMGVKTVVKTLSKRLCSRFTPCIFDSKMFSVRYENATKNALRLYLAASSLAFLHLISASGTSQA